MERFKQSIATLEKEVADLKQTIQSIKGSPPAKGDTHYVTSSQEFGEYSLEELDTFRFSVTKSGSATPNIYSYSYTLRNPTPELKAYLDLQLKPFSTQYITVKPENFESYCMKEGGTPFVLTKEIRACLESKLWEYPPEYLPGQAGRTEGGTITTNITIPFKHTYKISPHISYYITPIPQFNSGIDSCEIKEITTKQVVFHIKYGNSKNTQNQYIMTDPSLKLHYSISGIVTEDIPLILE